MWMISVLAKTQTKETAVWNEILDERREICKNSFAALKRC